MPSQDQGLYRQQHRLQAQDHGMDEPHRIDGMQEKCVQRANVLVLQRMVIAGIGIGDAAATRRNALKRAGENRLEKYGEGAGCRQTNATKPLPVVCYCYLPSARDAAALLVWLTLRCRKNPWPDQTYA